MIRTRFAPSPTGYLHIGGVRTALFCWLFARRHGGRFVLRIEDTDRARSTQASTDAILEGMQWLGLAADEGPYFQSSRTALYVDAARRLVDGGRAYHCYCAPEELDEMRARQRAAGENPRYDGRCRERSEPRAGVAPVVRLKTPTDGSVTIEDLVHGRVEFANADLDDLVILRSDGTPTYHLTVVVDDADMQISHVIRGDDHLKNTPRQVHLADALGLPRPQYAHVPMILGEDGARMSKRHGAVNVLEYREQGYLPDALLNYLVRLGWSHGDQEVFSRDELVELFDISAVNAAAARHNPDKLLWLNQQYIMAAAPASLAPALLEQYRTRGVDVAGGPPVADVVAAYRERARTLGELADASLYLYRDFDAPDAAAAKKHLRPVVLDALTVLRELLAGLADWRREDIHAAVETAAARASVGFGKVGQPLRVAVTGGAVSPPVDVTCELVGRDRALARLDRALDYVRQRAAS